MKYILFIKDDIAVAKALRKTITDIELGVYDNIAEITLQEYNDIELPAIREGDKWIKTDMFPKIEYPIIEETSETPTEIEQLRADVDYIAVMTGVTL